MPAGFAKRCHILEIKSKTAQLPYRHRFYVHTDQTCKNQIIVFQDMQYFCLHDPLVLCPAVVELVLAGVAAVFPVLSSIHYAVPAFQASCNLASFLIFHFIINFKTWSQNWPVARTKATAGFTIFRFFTNIFLF